MLARTHLVIGIFGIILFWPLVNAPIPFAVVVLIASLFPDIDNAFSRVGKNIPAKLVQVVTEHRGFIHSLTFCVLISVILSVFVPILAFGFFLGYSLHLLTDSFTRMGITPFWPYSRIAKGHLITGGVVEKGIFFMFVFLDILTAIVYLF